MSDLLKRAEEATRYAEASDPATAPAAWAVAADAWEESGAWVQAHWCRSASLLFEAASNTSDWRLRSRTTKIIPALSEAFQGVMPTTEVSLRLYGKILYLRLAYLAPQWVPPMRVVSRNGDLHQMWSGLLGGEPL